MKDIHPQYFDATITCACGAVYRVGSTKPSLRVEICAKCHPFFTGKQKLVDTGGRVERFLKKYGRASGGQAGERTGGEAGGSI